MPKKTRKTKGIHPCEPQTTRTLIPDELRFAILSDHMLGDTNIVIGRKHHKNRRTVLKTITKARERAERDNRPLLYIANIQETPGKWGHKRKFSTLDEADLVQEVVQNQANREIPAS